MAEIKLFKKLKRFEYKAITAITHFDIITLFYDLVKDLRINIKFTYVLRYQDKISKELSI